MPSGSCFDSWAELGNPGWDWLTMAPYFQKFHTLTMPSPDGIQYTETRDNYPQVQPTSGPIQASFPELSHSPLPRAWNQTLKNLGYGFKGDLARGQVLGSYGNPASIDPTTRQRSYSAKAYFEPVKTRHNLKVLTGAQVHKISFLGTTSAVTATGVDFEFDGRTITATARKEVILAAGALQSPKLLELSGIGDAELLRSHGIPIIIENGNVGENLQDHLLSGISFEVAEGVETLDDLARQVPSALQSAIVEYTTKQTGAFSRASVNSVAFVPVQESNSFLSGQQSMHSLLSQNLTNLKTNPPQHGFCRTVVSTTSQPSGMLLMYAAQGNWGSSTAKDIVTASLPENYITLAAMLLHPFSSGKVHIESNNAKVKPTIDMKYLTHPLDVEVLARHVMFLETLAKTNPLAGLIKPGGKRNPLYQVFETLDTAKEYVRETAISNWHPVGTCAMMDRARGGVVDKNLVVYGKWCTFKCALNF
jgi:choline dehydrogenase-like flavoprotein